MNNTFNQLFSQQLTRREFLTKAGLLLLTVTGVSGILKSLSGNKTKQDSGFGSGPYGR